MNTSIDNTIKCTVYFAGLVLLVLLSYCNAPLEQSLWLDETVTAWIISGDLEGTIERAYQYQGQSPLFFLVLWSAKSYLGSNELGLRIVSILSGVLSCGLVFLLARRAFSTSVGLLAVFVLLSLDGVLIAIFSARPYSLALTTSLFSFVLFDAWVQQNRIVYWVGYLLFAALTLYLHYLFLPIVTVHLAMLVLGGGHRDGKKLGLFILGVFLALLSLLPVAEQLLSLSERTRELSFVALPQVVDLLKAFVPPYTLLCLLTGIVFAWISFRAVFTAPGSKRSLKESLPVLLVWYLAPPLLFWIFSHLSGNSIFVERYFMWYLAGLAILVALLFECVGPPRAQLAAVSLFMLFVLVRAVDRKWHIEHWREIAQVIQERSQDSTKPVLLYSGLVESDNIGWLTEESHSRYLSAPFQYYPIPNSIHFLPSQIERDEVKEYLAKQVDTQVSPSSGFFFVSAVKKRRSEKEETTYLHDLYLARFTELGCQMETLHDIGEVVAFECREGGEGAATE